MNQSASLKKFIPLAVLSAVLTVIVSILGTPILRVLRNVYGAKLFWSAGLLITVLFTALQMAPVAALIASSWLVMGLYAEFEERGHANFWTGAISVVISTAVIIFGPVLAAKWLGYDIVQDIRTTVANMMTQIKGSGVSEAPTTFAGVKIDTDFIMSQIPSVMFVLTLINFAFGLMLDRRMGLLTNLPYTQIASRIRLLEFRVPEGFVWLAMAAFLGTFLNLKNPQITVISSNIFTIMAGIYFFQGLAILEMTMLSFRLGPLMRFLIYFIIVGQLFFILSAVGFVDYWIDFRKRLKNFRMEKKSNNGEQI